MEHVISMKNVSKRFKENIAIKNLSFNVTSGEIFGFLGPSGAGKTTTIKILTSQLIASSGLVKVLGKDLLNHNKEIYKEIGVLTDTSGLYERLSVYDNLLLFAKINDISKDRIFEVLDKVGLLDTKGKEVKKLSKGMRQRIMIARAVLHKPKLLFLDEPTSSLDPGTVLDIHTLLRELNKEGTTIFLTTHNMEEADKLCDRVAFLNDGEIVELGKPQELKLRYSSNEIKVMVKGEDEFKTIRNDKHAANKVHEWMSSGKLLSIHSTEPNLEDIFLTLTGRGL